MLFRSESEYRLMSGCCRRFTPVVTRREMLRLSSIGFGSLALASLLREESVAGDGLTPKLPLWAPTAKRVIFLFMSGGPSHIDLFDPKPLLDRDHGKPLPFKERGVQFAKRGNLMRSPWKFRRTGNSGLPMSELWQHLPNVADELCMIHSMCETGRGQGPWPMWSSGRVSTAMGE